MTSSQLRTSAREALRGKWGKAALITLVYVVISYVIGLILGFIPLIGLIASYAITIPLTYGILVSFVKLKRGEDVSYTDFLNFGFSNFKKVWAVFGNMLLKLIIPFVLIVVSSLVMTFGGAGAIVGVAFDTSSAALGFSGITIIGLIGYIASTIYLVVKGYLYSLVYYILNDNPDKTGKEIVEESEKLMRGNRWRYFWLGLTFIGWAILASFTFGIGMFWLLPYIQVTFVAFYESLAGTKGEVESTSVSKNE